MFTKNATLSELPSHSHIELYVFEDWDGADGRFNRPNGFITDKKEFADMWIKENTGCSYKTVTGVLVRSAKELEAGETELEKLKILAKLTEREKEILGLVKKPTQTTVRPRGME